MISRTAATCGLTCATGASSLEVSSDRSSVRERLVDSYGLGHTTTGYTPFVLLMVVLAAAALFRRLAAEASRPPRYPGPGYRSRT